MNDREPQMRDVATDEFDRDLSADRLAGQNLGTQSDDARQPHRTAYELKPVRRALSDWQDDDLKQIPVLPEGAPLRQGATYINLADASREEFTAMGGMHAGAGDAIIPKDDVRYTTWNRLRGIDSPERTGGETRRDR